MAKKSILPVDLLVGQNIRICRMQRGFSQSELGRRLGVTFQQIQKYEKGTNRLGSSRLVQIAGALDVPLATLLDGAAARGEPDLPGRALLAKPYALRLLQAFDAVSDNKKRIAILQLVEAIVEAAARRGPAAQGSGQAC